MSNKKPAPSARPEELAVIRRFVGSRTPAQAAAALIRAYG